ncbi:hypothetical protein C2I36_15055 [Rhodobacteraceae bacterium WD3A24]|nr:hypothetical protein C2I36_15055 [Rhodobacteraceae bacterium WD3A24]
MTRVTIRDIRTARICFKGARGWFRRHGLDWSDFVQNGIEAERLAETGDPPALRAVRAAEEREARDGRQ